MERKETSVHKDVYAFVTDRIVDQLNKGVVPWRKPWSDGGIPRNLISHRAYRGINVMLLASLGYEQNYFLTYKQLKTAGGKIKQGERGHLVVYWNFAEFDLNDGINEKRKIPYLRYYTVYNIAQCEGLEELIPPFDVNELNPIPACERIVAEMPNPPKIQHKEQKAYYNPLIDVVNMPKQNSFDTIENYYVTLFHELVHSTGHISRLNRKDLLQMAEFGCDPYSQEELVAEMGACYVLSYAGIPFEMEQSAAYIAGWLCKLQYDRRFVFNAATLAQKAADYILNLKPEFEQAQRDLSE